MKKLKISGTRLKIGQLIKPFTKKNKKEVETILLNNTSYQIFGFTFTISKPDFIRNTGKLPTKSEDTHKKSQAE